MLELCYGCGLRVIEVCHLRVSDIDSQRGQSPGKRPVRGAAAVRTPPG
ncbi:tyrosine-type recombinase/integrase [Aidingimonas lacisalsi]